MGWKGAAAPGLESVHAILRLQNAISPARLETLLATLPAFPRAGAAFRLRSNDGKKSAFGLFVFD
jgi:hypothetical protein